MQQSGVFEQCGGARDVRRQPAVAVIGRHLFAQHAPGTVGAGAETLRLAGYLVLARNSPRDYAGLADLADALGPKTVAGALSGIDAYYSGQPADGQWMATQLVCRLADPDPTARGDYTSGDDALGASTDWEHVQGRCLAVAVAMLEEAR